ncbi:hypothetical protein Aduo_011230 [Ancylostoma duodenale]
MRERILPVFIALLFLAVVFLCIYNYKIGYRWRMIKTLSAKELGSTISTKWIVISSKNYSYEEIEHWAQISGWEVLVVGDTKAPNTSSWGGVHFLGVDEQERLGYRIVKNLPQTSNSHRNIGYLFAIEHGAEWIYDTDDSVMPYGLGLEQFDYTDEVSGIRFGCNRTERSSSPVSFSPYRFFNGDHIWPEGFPLEYLRSHTNEGDRYCLCHKMRTAAVQHGLIHGSRDTDSIYRLLHTDEEVGIDEEFSRMAPGVVLDKGAFSSWKSRNTLFNRRAFFTLYFPTTVSSCAADMWRSYFAQKLLHTVDETVAFHPSNAVEISGVHDDSLEDFETERKVVDIYLDAGRIVEFLDKWKCTEGEVTACIVLLAEKFSKEGFWGDADAELVKNWILDLENIGYEFPTRGDHKEYSAREDIRGANCRRADIQFGHGTQRLMKKSTEKLKLISELAEWCRNATSSDVLRKMPSPKQLAESHAKNGVLSNLEKSVLVITSNYPWNRTVGVLQRIYTMMVLEYFQK